MASDLQVLITARAILSSPSSWTKEVWARDEDAQPVAAADSTATSFCAYGALCRAQFILKDPIPLVLRPVQLLSYLNFGSYGELADWNDDPNRTHAEVLARLDAAISTLAEENLSK